MGTKWFFAQNMLSVIIHRHTTPALTSSSCLTPPMPARGPRLVEALQVARDLARSGHHIPAVRGVLMAIRVLLAHTRVLLDNRLHPRALDALLAYLAHASARLLGNVLAVDQA